MTNIELSEAERELLVTMLTKEIEETRVEYHHAKVFEFKQYLMDREKILKEFLAKLQ